MEVSVSQLDLTEGDIKLHDTAAATSAALSHLAVSVSNLQYPATTFSWLSLQAMLPTTSRFMLEGSLSACWVGDFATSVQGLDLPPWNAYAKSFGVSLDAGTLSLQTKLSLNGSTIKADNEIVLSHLGLSLLNPNSFTREFGVPIDLTLALLQDPAGNIRLTIPVQFDETGSTVSKKEVAGSAMRAAVFGALSSPLKIIGAGLGAVTPQGKNSKASLGSNPILIPPLRSVAGSAEPPPEVAARARGIVKLLAERPEVALVLRGRTGAEDRPILAEQILLEQAAAGERLPEIPDAGFLARRWVGEYLAKRNRGESVTLDAKDSAVFLRFVAAVEVPRVRLDALSKARAEKVKALLVAKGAKPSSLIIGDPEAAGAPGVVLSFQLAKAEGKTPTKTSSR